MFPGGGAEGLVLSTDARVLCAFPKDSGSGSAFHGGCEEHSSVRGWYKSPHTLSSAMAEQSENYNEVIVGDREWWERNLPQSVAAVVYLQWRPTPKGPRLENGTRARAIHSAFLREYGLTVEQVPLVRYTWNPYRAGPYGFEDAYDR